MARLSPAVAAVRAAVGPLLTVSGEPGTPGMPVLVACSGGADSLALLAAATSEGARREVPVIGATVDHGLQEGSAERAERVVAQMARLGATETVSVRVTVQAAGRGLEAAAREARYAVLAEVAQRFASRRVLLGHTLDDQAETVLLGLTRGSGARSLSGMRASFEVFARPLLGITREQTEQACRAQGLSWWEDPHNSDPRFTRSRIRHAVMPLLEAELGPGVAAALARTAEQLAWDNAALHRLAEEALRGYDPDRGLVVGDLGRLDRAVRLRALRAAAVAAGSPPGELFQVHVLALDDQVGNRSHLPRRVDLPGHVRAVREHDVLRFERPLPPLG